MDFLDGLHVLHSLNHAVGVEVPWLMSFAGGCGDCNYTVVTILKNPRKLVRKDVDSPAN